MRRRLTVLACVLAASGCDAGSSVGPDAGDPGDPADAGTDAFVSTATEVLDLGHATTIEHLTREGDRALSLDREHHWVLWDLPARTAIARGDGACPSPRPCSNLYATLRGGGLLVAVAGALELRDAATGAVAETIATTATRFGLASDGSYAWAASESGLELRRRGGGGWTRPGNYGGAVIFAAPGELRVAGGPAGSDRIELIAAADQSATTFAIAGVFHSWFLDGEHLFTHVGDTVRVYTRGGTSVALAVLPTIQNLAGDGAYVWTYQDFTPGYPLRIYTVADLAAAPVQLTLDTSDRVVAGHRELAILDPGFPSFERVSLGATVERGAPIAVPVPSLTAFASDAGGWLIGNVAGAVFAGDVEVVTPALAHGMATSLAGSPGGTAAIATASGRLLLLAVGDTTGVTRELSIMSSHVELSTDGSLLVAGGYDGGAQYFEDRSLYTVDVADGRVRNVWGYRWSDDPLYFDFNFARTGKRLSHLLMRWNGGASWDTTPIHTDVDGDVLPYFGPAPESIGGPPYAAPLFSPSGTRICFTPPGPNPDALTTQIYADGAISGAVEGIALGWLDDERLLVATYRYEGGHVQSFPFEKISIHGLDGGLLATTALPAAASTLTRSRRDAVVPVDGTAFYVPDANAIFEHTTGGERWRGDPDVRNGVPAGDHILFTRRERVYVDRFR